MPPGAAVKIVVASPHRDDAAFSLGLAIERWLCGGHRVHVLNCFTRSSYAPYSDVETVHLNDRESFVSALRKREDTAWNKLLAGKLQFTDLDLLDAPIRVPCSVEEVQTVAIRPGDRAVARIAGAISKLARALKKSELAVVVPLAVGEHIDHRVTRQAALEALSEMELAVAFYEDLPYAARTNATDEIEQCSRGTGLQLSQAFAEAASTEPAESVKRKVRIAESYDSQIDSETVQQIANFSTRYGGRERLWANEVWQNSSLFVRS